MARSAPPGARRSSAISSEMSSSSSLRSVMRSRPVIDFIAGTAATGSANPALLQRFRLPMMLERTGGLKGMLGLMQDWPLLVHKIIDHAALYHGGREMITREID